MKNQRFTLFAKTAVATAITATGLLGAAGLFTTADAGAATPPLAVRISETPNPVPAGSNATFTITTTNDSSTAVSDTILEGLPQPINETQLVISSTGLQSCTRAGPAVYCDLGSLAAGAAVTTQVVVQTTPDDAGHTLTFSASTAPRGSATQNSAGDNASIPVGSAISPGYELVSADGGIFSEHAQFYGSLGGQSLSNPIVGGAATTTGKGYWLVDSAGRVAAFGDAANLGSVAGPLNGPIVGMAAAPHGSGYWLVAADGGVFTFGDVGFYGSAGNIRLNKPIVGIAPTPDGGGYRLDASDGGIFTYGDAYFEGSTGAMALNEPIVGMATDPATGGYWLVASDGGVFSFNAPFEGSTGAMTLNKPIVAMIPIQAAD